jgi:hypothetical protein
VGAIVRPHFEEFEMDEIIFLVEDALEGGFIAKALGVSIFTQADDINDLHCQLREALSCHFEATNKPKIYICIHNLNLRLLKKF